MDREAGESTRAPVAAWLPVALAALGLATVSALLVPLMALPDEPAHAGHAAAVVRGHLVGEDRVVVDSQSGFTRTETIAPVPRAYADLDALPVCFAFRPEVTADCAPPVADTPGPETPGASTVGTYAPPWYALVGWPTLVFEPWGALLAARVLGAVLFSLLMGMAAASAWRVGASRWGLVGLLLAMPPVAVHLAGGINPSGTEIGAAVALWAASAELLLAPRHRAAVGRWVVAAVLLAVARPLGPVLVVGVTLATALVLDRSQGRLPDVAGDTRVRRAVAGVVVVVVAALAWSLARGTLAAFSGFPEPGLGALGTLRRSIGLVPERLTEMVGVLGWADVTLPRVLVAAWLAAVVVLLVVAMRRADRRARAWLAVLAGIVLLLPIVADLRSAATIGFVWQGRYTLPVAVGLPVLAGILLDRAGERVRVGPAPAVVLVATGHVVALLAVGRRFQVGIPADLWTHLTGGAWEPPVADGLLLAIGLVSGILPLLTLRHRAPALRGGPATDR